MVYSCKQKPHHQPSEADEKKQKVEIIFLILSLNIVYYPFPKLINESFPKYTFYVAETWIGRSLPIERL